MRNFSTFVEQKHATFVVKRCFFFVEKQHFFYDYNIRYRNQYVLKNASAIPFYHANKFESKLLTLSTTLFFNNPSVDNWFSFLIKYSLVNSSF